VKRVKIQGHTALREEIVCGEKKAPKDADVMSVDSIEALLCLLTPQNPDGIRSFSPHHN